jgi:hypothetical protein
LAAIPNSIIPTSPALTVGIFFLHAVEHGRAFQRLLIAQRDLLILRRQFEHPPASLPQLRCGQIGQFVNNFRRAHGRKLMRKATFVMQKLTRAETQRSQRGKPEREEFHHGFHG